MSRSCSSCWALRNALAIFSNLGMKRRWIENLSSNWLTIIEFVTIIILSNIYWGHFWGARREIYPTKSWLMLILLTLRSTCIIKSIYWLKWECQLIYICRLMLFVLMCIINVPYCYNWIFEQIVLFWIRIWYIITRVLIIDLKIMKEARIIAVIELSLKF